MGPINIRTLIPYIYISPHQNIIIIEQKKIWMNFTTASAKHFKLSGQSINNRLLSSICILICVILSYSISWASRTNRTHFYHALSPTLSLLRQSNDERALPWELSKKSLFDYYFESDHTCLSLWALLRTLISRIFQPINQLFYLYINAIIRNHMLSDTLTRQNDIGSSSPIPRLLA